MSLSSTNLAFSKVRSLTSRLMLPTRVIVVVEVWPLLIVVVVVAILVLVVICRLRLLLNKIRREMNNGSGTLEASLVS